ncbi:MAG: hypothetical protein JKY08_05965 [Flavobacteriaceae bacterium]|nr:hypothetical protein [Flavobacteriaceae bacterium]
MTKPPLTFANVTAEKPKARGILMKHKEKTAQSNYSKMGAPKKAIEEIR